MHGAAGAQRRPAGQEIEGRHRSPELRARLASCKVQLDSAAVPGARQEELGKHLCTHTHSHTKPICIQVQSHTSTHGGTLTDTHNTPPKSHQTARLLK